MGGPDSDATRRRRKALTVGALVILVGGVAGFVALLRTPTMHLRDWLPIPDLPDSDRLTSSDGAVDGCLIGSSRFRTHGSQPAASEPGPAPR